MNCILVVEDQISLLNSLKRGLQEEGFSVATASTGREAYRYVQSDPVLAIVLDLMLPDGDGMDLLKRLREEEFRMPILVVTAKDSVHDRVRGLDSGADDYLTKPFDFSELVARLRAILRRSESSDRSSLLRYENLEIDSIERKATRTGQVLSLTHRQFELLEYLLRHKNQIVTRENIARDVWKASTATWTNVIEVQINQLRKKLALPGGEPILHTIRGEGYLLGDEP